MEISVRTVELQFNHIEDEHSYYIYWYMGRKNEIAKNE